MKRLISLVLILAFVFSLCSCNKKSEEKTTSVSKSDSKTVSTDVETDKIDFDITKLSSTMAYSQVSEMTSNSAKYLGKKVKIKGNFLVEETADRNYYACHISDTTACCSVGFEFVLKDTNIKYPDDYPTANSEITVEGIFHTYKEGDNTYCELTDAVMTKS